MKLIKEINKAAEEFADDYVANNPGAFETSVEESYVRDLLKRTYIAGALAQTYVQMGYAQDET